MGKLPLELFSQALMMSSKNPLTFLQPSRYITPKKVQTRKCRIFVIEAKWLSASLDGLNSSPSLSVGKLWLDKIRATIVVLRSMKG